MARGSNHPLRATLAGRATLPVSALPDDPATRSAALERLWDFLAEYYDPLTAESERMWLETRPDPGARTEALSRRAEDLSRILGYEYGSYGGDVRRAACAACGQTMLVDITGAVYGPGNALFHQACMPPRAGRDYGFVRGIEEPERFFIRAFAELDAGIVRPGALPAPGRAGR